MSICGSGLLILEAYRIRSREEIYKSLESCAGDWPNGRRKGHVGAAYVYGTINLRMGILPYNASYEQNFLINLLSRKYMLR